MVVHHFDYFDGSYPSPIKTPIFLQRNWVIRWYKNEPVRMIQIHSKLPLTVFCQFMTARLGKATDDLKVLRSLKVIQSPPNQSGSQRPLTLFKLAKLIAFSLKFPALKYYIHLDYRLP
jgi:hypothetical protein